MAGQSEHLAVGKMWCSQESMNTRVCSLAVTESCCRCTQGLVLPLPCCHRWQTQPTQPSTPAKAQYFTAPRPSAATNSSCAPGGSDCFSLVAFSASVTHRVYRYLLQRTLNFVVPVLVFLILTDRASLRRAVSRKSLISVIWRGCGA